MMPMTPSGTRTRSMVMPLGWIHDFVMAPTGSLRPAIASIPAAIASTRLSSSESRSMKAAPMAAERASARSSAFALRISLFRMRTAAAMARSALFFCSEGASASTRAAARAARPIPVSCPARPLAATGAVPSISSVLLSGAVISQNKAHSAPGRGRRVVSRRVSGREVGPVFIGLRPRLGISWITGGKAKRVTGRAH